jgi:hypothetical protein
MTDIELFSSGSNRVRTHSNSKKSSYKMDDDSNPLHDILASAFKDVDYDTKSSKSFNLGDLTARPEVPDMFSKEYIGLYCQYAAVGLLYGSAGNINSIYIVYIINFLILLLLYYIIIRHIVSILFLCI